MKNRLSKYISVLLLSMPMVMNADIGDDFTISQQEYNQIEAKLSLMSEDELNNNLTKLENEKINIINKIENSQSPAVKKSK